LEEIFRANAVKVALGKSQVRLMRLVQPLPPEGERLAREKVKGDKGKGSKRAEEQGSQKQAAEGKPARPDKVEPVQLPATTVFDQRGQTVGTQINVAGDYVEQRPSGGTRYEIHIEHASGLAIGDGAQVVQASSKSGDRGDTDAVTPLRRQLVEAEANLALIQERKTQYVLEVDVPLQLIKEERRLLARIADLKEKLGKQA
jgi:hypothetical protein